MEALIFRARYIISSGEILVGLCPRTPLPIRVMDRVYKALVIHASRHVPEPGGSRTTKARLSNALQVRHGKQSYSLGVEGLEEVRADTGNW